MTSVLKIILKSGKDDAVRRYHPWVFSGAIKKMSGRAWDGCYAEVYSNKDEYLGCGIYQDASIAVRIMAFAPEKPESFGPDFWNEKIRAAYELRKTIGLADAEDTNVYRLVHGEGDHLPGLIIDHYNGHLVIQVHSVGLHGFINPIADALKQVYGDKLISIYDKSEDTLPAAFWTDREPAGFIHGTAGDVEVLEHGHRFTVDIIKGQKTGFFIDQRDNRQLLARYAGGKKILNAFCYSGGFSVYALKAGAREVHSLDSSAKAIALTEKNILLNTSGSSNHRCITEDAPGYLRQAANEAYNLIILDPPAYAKHQHVKHNAVQGYKRLNLEALKAIQSGGIIFTFSCSQVVDMKLFHSTVMSAAILAARRVRVLHQLTQPADHPVNIFHPEGHYLKGLVLAVD
ncbi:MAG: class I SAM-dependent rRNA methyltransferase [Bacteroidales bacterium]|nr:class I SAM-dependent rRNA methyltransferase [Bacteroidales bacterium]